MQLQTDRSHRLDEMKTQFRAREGYYKLVCHSDYSQRSQRAMNLNTGTTNSNSSTASNEKTFIKISLVTINDSNDTVPGLTRISQPASVYQRTPGSGPIGTSSASRIPRRPKSVCDKKICFNVGRDLFVYNFVGVRAGPDSSSHPIYKRSYKGSLPTCHDFNQATATSGSLSLLVGLSHGQIQLIDMNGSGTQEGCKEFNYERLIDKTRVTCIKWLPNSPTLFLVAHASGQLYLYKDDLPCGPAPPTYQLYKQSEGVTVYSCKTKTTRNPIYKWTIGSQCPDTTSNPSGLSSPLHNAENEGRSLNEFVFSPCGKYLACVSQDGFLRVFCYDTMELVGRARSYYGGLSCVCWSPDGKYVVIGGEDDLITVWSFVERRVVARGIGHKSWVSVVAFDSFHNGYDLKDTDVDNDDDEDDESRNLDDRDLEADIDDEDEDEDAIRAYDEAKDSKSRGNRLNRIGNSHDDTRSQNSRANSDTRNFNYSPSTANRNSVNGGANPVSASYRFGSVGQDTQLCLWDLNDDLLKQPIAKPKISTITGAQSAINLSVGGLNLATNNDRDLSNNAQQKPTDDNNPQTSALDPENKPEGAIQETSAQVKEGGVSSVSTGGFLSSKGSGFTKTFSLVGKRDKRNYSQRNVDKNSNSKNSAGEYNSNSNKLIEDPTKLLGSPICPRMNEVPILEPSVCKKISLERLTSLIFCKKGFITSCQEGYIFSWARPSRRSTEVSSGQSIDVLRVIDVGTSSVV